MGESSDSSGGASQERVMAAPPIRIEAFEEYLLGFPFLVAVTCENPTTTRTFGNLPKVDLFKAPGPVEFVFVSQESGRRIALPAAVVVGVERMPRGFTLRPGESRRMLFDISELDPPLRAGTYQLGANYHRRLGSSTALPVKTRIVEPSPSDSTLANLLRQHNDVMEPSWGYFLLNNWRTIRVAKKPEGDRRRFPEVLDASELSAEGKEALAFHLFLHRAIYGPARIEELNLRQLEAFAKGPLEGEAAVLRFEILTARKDSSAAVEEARILERWPGLEWRIEETKEGYGFLGELRRHRGAERTFQVEPDFFPYTDKR